MALGFSRSDYAQALLSLLPRGRVWPKFDEATQAAVARGLAGIYEQSDIDAVQLIAEAFPPTTSQLLEEWEATLGLPDPCAGEDQSVADRLNQVVARFTNAGGQSIATLIAYAAALGFDITIGEDAPFRMGESVMGDHLGGDDWMLAWQIQAPLSTIHYFVMGEGAMGDALQTFGNTLLECELTGLGPLHTFLTFVYGYDLPEGIGLDFETGLYYRRSIDGDPFVASAFTDLFNFSRSSSATYIGADGLLHTAAVNAPRIEYDADGNLRGLLIEGAPATNQWIRSNELDHSTQVIRLASTVTPNVRTWLDGTLTMDKFVEAVNGGVSAEHIVRYITGNVFTAGDTVCFSTVVEPAERTKINLRLLDNASPGDGANAFFDLAAGTVSSGPGAIGANATNIDAGIFPLPGGRFLCWLTVKCNATVTAVIADAFLVTGATTFNYIGDGVSGVYMGGMQVEAGLAPTSRIATAGSPVTRARDVCQRIVSDEFSQFEGTFFLKYQMIQSDPPASSVNQFLVDTRHPVTSNSVQLFHANSGGTVRMSVNSAGGFAGLAFTATPPGDLVDIKAAGAFAVNDVAVCLDGVLGTPDLSAPLPIDLMNQINLGNSGDGSQRSIAVWIKQFTYYPERKSNADLQALTA